MRAIARSGLLALSAVACLVAATRGTYAQAPPATKPAAFPPAAAVAASRTADLNTSLATVNGEDVTKGELVNFLSQYRIPAGNEEQVYRDAMDTLVNTHLVNQFLAKQGIKLSEEKVNEAVASLEKELKSKGSDIATQLLQSNMSLAEVRKQYANRIRWVEYLDKNATDAELKKFSEAHKDLFNGTQVKASHILLKIDPKASAEDKEKVRQKLLGIKKDIEANKLSFSEAANKHSEDPSNVEGAGGDIGYFTLNSGIIEEFAKAAFALKKGSISDVVETPYGYHLIQLTDRKEGSPIDFEQQKPLVKQVYAADLQKNVLSSERKKAKIDIKPIPSDFFPKAPALPPAAAAPAAKK